VKADAIYRVHIGGFPESPFLDWKVFGEFFDIQQRLFQVLGASVKVACHKAVFPLLD